MHAFEGGYRSESRPARPPVPLTPEASVALAKLEKAGIEARDASRRLAQALQEFARAMERRGR